MHCPTLDEITGAILSLLPRGRAWQTNEGSPRPSESQAFSAGAFSENAFATKTERPNILWSYWRSVAAVVFYLNQRLCALRLEFWCQSISETRDGWMQEYGLPDACDPFPDLCTKVAAIGGTRCDYYAEIAARLGWTIECVNLSDVCGMSLGFSRVGHSKTVPGYFGQTQMAIIVHTDLSPAFVPSLPRQLMAGRARARQRAKCGAPDFTALSCLLSRVVHAEITLIFQPA